MRGFADRSERTDYVLGQSMDTLRRATWIPRQAVRRKCASAHAAFLAEALEARTFLSSAPFSRVPDSSTHVPVGPVDPGGVAFADDSNPANNVFVQMVTTA